MRVKSQLRFGLWPESRAPHHIPAKLFPAARKQAEAAIEELQRAGVTVTLGDDGRAKFKSASKTPPVAVRLTIERFGDVIEAHLRERQ